MAINFIVTFLFLIKYTLTFNIFWTTHDVQHLEYKTLAVVYIENEY